MKKIIVICVICLVLIGGVLFFYNKDKEYNPNFYKKETTYKTLGEKSINKDNINLSLKVVEFDGINNDKMIGLNLTDDEMNKIIKDSAGAPLNLLIEISTKDGSNLSDVMFEYMIYDSDKLLSSNVGIINWQLPIYNQFYNKYIINDINKDSDILMFEKGIRKSIIRDDLNKILYLIRAEENDDIIKRDIDLSEIHVLIMGINYRDFENKKINLNEDVFEFIIKK